MGQVWRWVASGTLVGLSALGCVPSMAQGAGQMNEQARPAVAAPAAKPTDAHVFQIEPFLDFVETAIARDGTPGAAIAVVLPGGRREAHGIGFRRLDTPDRVNAATLFGIGSLTKAFAAATVAAQVARGSMAWDGLVSSYRPETQLSDPRLLALFNVRDMLGGRTGLSLMDEIPLRVVTDERDTYLRYATRLPPRAGFRDRFVYSNAMYTLAGATVAKVARKPWPQVLQDDILTPAGMTGTLAETPAIESAANRAEQHIPGPDGKLRYLPWGQYGREAGEASGAIYSNAEDMSRWLDLQLSGGTIEGRRVLRAEDLAEMHSPQIIRREARQRSVGPSLRGRELIPIGYGFGWYVDLYRGQRLVHHSGGQGGYISYAALLPDHGFGVAVLLNGRSGSGLNRAIAFQALDRFLDSVGAPLPPFDWTVALSSGGGTSVGILAPSSAERPERRSDRPPSLPLAAYSGRYVGDVLIDGVRIELGETGLRLKVGLLDTPLEHWQGDMFRIRVTDRTEVPFEDYLTFRLEGRRVIGMGASRARAFQNLVRVAAPVAPRP